MNAPQSDPKIAADIVAGLAKLEANQEEYDKNATEQRNRRGVELMNEANTPLRQRKNRDLNKVGDWGSTFVLLREKLGTGFMIALTGGRGNGKTQLAVELIRSLSFAEKAMRSRYCTATEFFMEIKAAYRIDSGKTEVDIIKEFQKPSLLVIDEISKRRESDWEDLLLHELLNRRYNGLTDTLLICNQESKQLEESLGASLVSRMRETGGVVEAKWETFRK